MTNIYLLIENTLSVKRNITSSEGHPFKSKAQKRIPIGHSYNNPYQAHLEFTFASVKKD